MSSISSIESAEARLLEKLYTPSKQGFYHCICAAPEARALCKAKFHIQNPNSPHFIRGRADRRKAEALMLKGLLAFQPAPQVYADPEPTPFAGIKNTVIRTGE